ncbi:pseudouridylate synthase [Leptospira wolffii]|uniref:Pseudouridylate synthase n=1 Tax=Leptospira wolffii TaxID=409998 RepID=A0A2M9ZDL3_9LEPT|nr:RluA family pseudouridine synthase [Leptospira wolffii]PJZ66506.1 pseudouridylate synthase [Leptospira wolffii]
MFLAGRFTYQSRSHWRRILEEGKILVQGKKPKPSHILREGDEIVYLPEEIAEPPVRTDFRILYEDERYFAVEKPGDLPVHAAGRYRKNNLVDLIESDPRFARPYLIHRLDRETSGLVIFGKDKEAASLLSEQFAKRTVHKSYIAFVWGEFPKRLSARGILTSDPHSAIRKKRRFLFDSQKGPEPGEETESESCSTRFRKIGVGSIKGRSYSKVLCRPQTGRLHQIRATLYSLGFPLLGDKMYGSDEKVFLDFIEGKEPDLDSLLGMSRQALHSSSISFLHPFRGKRIRIRSPLSEDFPV